MKIHLGFSTTNSIFSKLIRVFTRSDASHVYIRVYDEFLKTPLIFHADWSGVEIEHAEKFDIENKVIEEFVIDDDRLDRAIKNCLWHLGKRYNYFRLINLGLFVYFKRWFVRKIKNPTINPRSLICVDFVIYALNDSGITRLPIGVMTQRHLHAWCNENFKDLSWVKYTPQFGTYENVKAKVLADE